jgi:hypothetical protein
MVSAYNKYELCVTINKVIQGETKPVVICNYNVNMLGVDLKDQLLQPYLLNKRGTKWYLKLFHRLLTVAIHNTVVTYLPLPNKKT